MSFNIERIRQETPACEDKLFVDSAGSSLVPKDVSSTVEEYLKAEEKYGGYRIYEMRKEQLDTFYSNAAKLLNTHSKNIAFAHDATDAYAKALSSIPFKSGDIIVTTDDDYASNHIQFLSLKRRLGIVIKRISNNDDGTLNLAHFEKLVNFDLPKLVAVTHVPTNSGMIQNIEGIGEICRQYSVPFLVDACQSIGQLPLDVHKIHCDFLSVTGRKFLRGPRGTGFLYVSDRMLSKGYAPLFLDGRGAKWTSPEEYEMETSAIRFQTWEAPYAMMAGLSSAMAYANELGIENIRTYNKELVNRLRENLKTISDVTIYDRGVERANIITFRKGDLSLQQINDGLRKHNVFFGFNQKEWGLLDFNKKGVDWVTRLSPHYFNTIDEMDRLAGYIEDL